MRPILVATLLLALSTQALAVPMNFSHQGRLFDAAGLPLDAPADVVFRIYDTPSGGTALWQETWTQLPFDNGHFAVELGTNTALDSAAFDGNTLYMSIQVGAGPEIADRLALVSVPYAIRAGDAEMAHDLASGLTIDAAEIRVNGTTVIDSSGMIDSSAVAGASDTLADLGCVTGQIAYHDGTDWTCRANQHDAGDITSGTLAISTLPIGTTSAHVAAGDHGHTASDVGALPSGTTAADIGGVMAGDALVVGDLSAACDSTRLGTIRYGSNGFEGCTVDGWLGFATGSVQATGGTVTDIGGYRVHTFTGDGSFDVVRGGDVEVLVVAGGGGGGGRSGGGGGAGGVVYDASFAVAAGQTLTVTVGAGGGGGAGVGEHGLDGAASVFDSLTAMGGGGGGSDTRQTGADGGSGGGGRYGNNGGTGVSGQGFDGGFGTSGVWAGGGGGGAGAAGVDGTAGGEVGDGGPGLVYDISGSDACYAGGGGGGGHDPANGRGFATSVAGLPCGGGNGGATGGKNPGDDGLPNTGGGGGAGSTNSSSGGAGGDGGSGVVIVRYTI